MASYPVLELEHSIRGYRTQTTQDLLVLLEELVTDDYLYFLAHPYEPHIYQTGTRYQLEKRGQERWQGSRRLRRKKRGDCEDLAADLAGWLRARKGIWAEAGLIRLSNGQESWYHAVTVLPDGRVIDPSKALGM